MAMPTTTKHAFDVLSDSRIPISSVVVLFGDDRFLQLEVQRHLITTWIGSDEADFAVTRIDGEIAQWPDVADALATGSLFSAEGRRIVAVDNAQEFVKNHRAALEDLVSNPSKTNTLILPVDSWPSNTRLYKMVENSGLQIDCGPPTSARGKSKQVDEPRIASWLIDRARNNYSVELSPSAADLLIELSTCSFGLFDQNLAKLACCPTDGKPVTPSQIAEWIGGWKINSVWQAVDAAVDGDAKKAFSLLDGLLRSGEHPLALFGQISWSLRRYAEALEIYDRRQREGQRPRIQDCLSPAGFRPWGGELQQAESRIKRLGARRARRLLRLLLDTDLALKGSHSHEARGRFALERLLAIVAAPAEESATRK